MRDVMLRLFTDFQAIEEDGALWILKYCQCNVDEVADDLHIAKGDRILLDAHEDFVVVGTLDYRFVKMLGRPGWVAYPDWSTRKETPVHS